MRQKLRLLHWISSRHRTRCGGYWKCAPCERRCRPRLKGKDRQRGAADGLRASPLIIASQLLSVPAARYEISHGKEHNDRDSADQQYVIHVLTGDPSAGLGCAFNNSIVFDVWHSRSFANSSRAAFRETTRSARALFLRSWKARHQASAALVHGGVPETLSCFRWLESGRRGRSGEVATCDPRKGHDP
jgi:hypothetical protein